MQRLKPFQGSLSTKIEAELLVQGNLLTFQYRIDGSEMVLGVPEQSGQWGLSEVPRQDGLWATTCFEAFLNPLGLDSYYEFNFSLRPAWNLYEFTNYRQPQPPKSSQAFQFKSLSWDATGNLLQVQLENLSEHRQFKVSLTAVLEEKNHSKHYLAVAHAEDKPDFHSKKSFTLQRGSAK